MKTFAILCVIATFVRVLKSAPTTTSKIGSWSTISRRNTQKSTKPIKPNEQMKHFKSTNVIQNSVNKLKHLYAPSFPRVKSAFISSFIVVAAASIIQQFLLIVVRSNLEYTIQSVQIKNEVNDMLKQSGVKGTCSVVILNSTENDAWTTTSPLGHHYLFLTSSLLSNFDKSELSAIIAHEVGHMKNEDIKTSSHWILSNFFIISLFESWYVRGLLVLMRREKSRRSEFLADIHSAKLMQSPRPLISALKKLDRLNGHSDEERIFQEFDKVYENHSLIDDFKECIGDIQRICEKIANVADKHPSTKDRILNLEAYASKYMWWYLPDQPLDVTSSVLNSDSIKSDNNPFKRERNLIRLINDISSSDIFFVFLCVSFFVLLTSITHE